MIFKLTKNLFEYLQDNLLDHIALKNKINIIKEEKDILFIETDENIADYISEWAKDELQKAGFDYNYHLNNKGKIIEKIIDAFYV